jgi:hypothetical protein
LDGRKAEPRDLCKNLLDTVRNPGFCGAFNARGRREAATRQALIQMGDRCGGFIRRPPIEITGANPAVPGGGLGTGLPEACRKAGKKGKTAGLIIRLAMESGFSGFI